MANEFEREAQGKRTGIVAEFWDFLKHNKKRWLMPILLAYPVTDLETINSR